MRRCRAFCKIALCLLIFAQAPASGHSLQGKPFQVTRQQSLINPIKDESVIDNCGCSFGYPRNGAEASASYIFITDYDAQTAWMNIDGRDMRLTLRHTTRPGRALRIGSRYRRTYEAPGIRVLVVYTVTRVCVPYSPDCEMTGYHATVTVRKRERLQRVKLEGACGCY